MISGIVLRSALRGASLVAGFAALASLPASIGHATSPQLTALRDPREVHLKNVRQLTFGGQNAEAYFSADSKRLIFQSEREGYPCDQHYTINVDGTDLKRISNGQGRTTCGWWYKNGKRVLYSSTFEVTTGCPPKPDYSKGYVWPVYPIYKIYSAKADGTDIRAVFPQNLKQGEAPGYNAEAVVSPDGKRVTFTSGRGGDLDIWVMDIDGKNAHQLTTKLGYEGGPWWSPDGKQICFRAFYPETQKEIDEYKSLLAQNLIRPTTLDLFVMNADGSNVRQITHDRASNIANFAPSWTRDGKSLLFASNRDDARRRKFEVYKINLDGAGLERITYGDQFDSFPNISPNGRWFVWASNRNGKVPHETNVFIAEWVP